MTDLFGSDLASALYIVQTGNNWYRLHLKETHYCLAACESLDKVLNTVKRYTKQFGSVSALKNRIRDFEDGGHVPENTREQFKQDYINFSAYRNDYLVKQAVSSVTELRKPKKALRKQLNLFKKLGTI